MMLRNHMIRKCSVGYKHAKSQEKINHQIYDIKPFAKNTKKELEILIQAVRIHSQDTGL